MNYLAQPIVEKIERLNEDPLILTERIGRLCYKSQSDYTTETAMRFYKQLTEREHYAMLEHAIFIFEIGYKSWARIVEVSSDGVGLVNDLKYFNVTDTGRRVVLSGSLRAFNECQNYIIKQLLLLVPPKNMDLLYYYDTVRKKAVTIPFEYEPGACSDIYYIPDIGLLPNLTREEMDAHDYMTFDITCDRGITHELVRHRNCAFAQESTRYCNYSKERFGSNILFSALNPEAVKAPLTVSAEDIANKLDTFYKEAESLYMYLVEGGVAPQFARSVLPTALKSQIILTANLRELKHIILLRYLEVTGKAHPDAKIVAGKMSKFLDEEILRLMG